MTIPPRVHEAARSHPYPLLFATLSGAHLYGFPSADSDWDLRGCHVLPAQTVLGLGPKEETLTVDRKDEGFELDLVTHDAEKFFRLMLKNNGYVLEQLMSPLLVVGGEAHDELKALGRDCVTRHHVHHYLGFARSQWTLFQKNTPPRVKPLLYVYRVLLTGIHLMRTGEIEANLVTLSDKYTVPGIQELIEVKTSGKERATLDPGHVPEHERRIEKLRDRLEQEGRTTTLPNGPSAEAGLSDLLVRLRLASTSKPSGASKS